MNDYFIQNNEEIDADILKIFYGPEYRMFHPKNFKGYVSYYDYYFNQYYLKWKVFILDTKRIKDNGSILYDTYCDFLSKSGSRWYSRPCVVFAIEDKNVQFEFKLRFIN